VRDAISANGTLYLGVDFGFAAPFVCLWIIETPDGTRHVIDEYVQDGRVTHEHVEQIRLRRGASPARSAATPRARRPTTRRRGRTSTSFAPPALSSRRGTAGSLRAWR
jgi:hypothetical protein